MNFSDPNLCNVIRRCCNFLKTFLSTSPDRTTGPISTRFGIKHPWVKGIHITSKKGPSPFPRGDNYEKEKIY